MKLDSRYLHTIIIIRNMTGMSINITPVPKTIKNATSTKSHKYVLNQQNCHNSKLS